MIAPHTCSPVDVYDKYRSVRGKSDISEGIGLPKDQLLQISANNPTQPCSSFGLHANLTVLKDLYDQQQVIFIANAGLLTKSVNTSNYYSQTPVQLFAHNDMTVETQKEDIANVYAGTVRKSVHLTQCE